MVIYIEKNEIRYYLELKVQDNILFYLVRKFRIIEFACEKIQNIITMLKKKDI